MEADSLASWQQRGWRMTDNQDQVMCVSASALKTFGPACSLLWGTVPYVTGCLPASLAWWGDSLSQWWQANLSPDIVKCPWGGGGRQNHLQLETTERETETALKWNAVGTWSTYMAAVWCKKHPSGGQESSPLGRFTLRCLSVCLHLTRHAGLVKAVSPSNSPLFHI